MSAINIVTQTLLAAAPVTAIVGQRVYPVFTPQGATLPCIVTRLVHEDDPDLLGGASQFRQSRVTVEFRTAGDIPQLFTLAAAGLDALQNKVNYAIAGCTATISKEGSDETDASDDAAPSGYKIAVRRVVDFYVWWR